MRNVIVTGASRGIGLEIAATLARAGYRVIAIARSSSQELAQLAQSLSEGGAGAVEFRAYDLSDLDGIPRLVRTLRTDFGTLYALVNNAGIGTPGVLGLMPDREVERLFRLNAMSPIVLTKHVLRSMMSARAGRIVNVTSIVALTGYTGLSVYSATKASLVGFTQSLAREVGQLGITVNAVAPGFVDTLMTGQLDQQQRTRIERRNALGRLVEPIDVARSVEFFLGEGGRNMTGVVLPIDAGATA